MVRKKELLEEELGLVQEQIKDTHQALLRNLQPENTAILRRILQELEKKMEKLENQLESSDFHFQESDSLLKLKEVSNFGISIGTYVVLSIDFAIHQEEESKKLLYLLSNELSRYKRQFNISIELPAPTSDPMGALIMGTSYYHNVKAELNCSFETRLTQIFSLAFSLCFYIRSESAGAPKEVREQLKEQVEEILLSLNEKKHAIEGLDPNELYDFLEEIITKIAE